MDKQDPVENLEYGRFLGRITMLTSMEIISRADLLAAYHFVLEYIKSRDFDLSAIETDTAGVDLDGCESIMDSLVDVFRFEADASVLYGDIDNALAVVLEEILAEQEDELDI